MMFHLLAFALFAIRLAAAAEFTPTAPGPGDKFTEGGDCKTEWTPDDTGAWKTTNIQLMTGPNNPMVHLTTLGTVDGSNPATTSFTFPCPKVTPHAAIYFLQFTAAGTPNVTWTGRWAITDASGALSDPQNATQPNGDAIPWGTGTLVGGGSPPPSTAPPGQIDGSKGQVDIASSSSSSSGSSGSSPLSSTSSGPSTGAILTPSTPSAVSTSSSPSGFTTVSTPLSSGSPAATPSNGTSVGNNNSATPFSISPLMALAAVLLGSIMI